MKRLLFLLITLSTLAQAQTIRPRAEWTMPQHVKDTSSSLYKPIQYLTRGDSILAYLERVKVGDVFGVAQTVRGMGNGKSADASIYSAIAAVSKGNDTLKSAVYAYADGVVKIAATKGVIIGPGSGVVSGSFSGVTKLIAGTNVTISPTSGLGAVTVNAKNPNKQTIIDSLNAPYPWKLSLTRSASFDSALTVGTLVNNVHASRMTVDGGTANAATFGIQGTSNNVGLIITNLANSKGWRILAGGSGGGNANRLVFDRDDGVMFATFDTLGRFGLGTVPSAKLHIVSTTEQLRIGYDASNYAKFTVGATGTITLGGVGNTGGKFVQDSAAYGDAYIEKSTQPDSIIVSSLSTFYTIGAVQLPNGYKLTSGGVLKNITAQDSSLTVVSTGVYKYSYIGNGRVLNMAAGSNLHTHLFVNDVLEAKAGSDGNVSASNAYFSLSSSGLINVTAANTIFKVKIISPDDASGTIIFNHFNLALTRIE